MNAPMLRVAWRDVLKHRRRSLLVMALIAMPVMLSSTIAIYISTERHYWAYDQPLREFGRGVAAVVTWQGGEVEQGPDTMSSFNPIDVSRSEARRRATTLAHRRHVASADRAATSVVTGHRAWHVDALSADFSDPLVRRTVPLASGRLPRTADEVVVSRDLHRAGVDVGERIAVGRAPMTVVGISAAEYQSAAFLPSARAITSISTQNPQLGNVHGWTFIVGGRPLSASEIGAWRKEGFSVSTLETNRVSGGVNSGETQLVALIVVSLVIEVILLAGPAFAVSVRRQRHDLALLAVTGASPRHLRRVVIAQAALLGGLAAVSGAAASFPAAWAAMHILRHYGRQFGAWDTPWAVIAGAVSLGVASAILAALLPARWASRAEVTTTLAGRQPDPKVNPIWPLIGAVTLFVGTASSATAGHWDSADFANAWWAVVAVIGAVLLTPWLISVVAKSARFLPVPARLAVRDADRHRARTAPAVAAVMASVSAVTALALGSVSDKAQSESTLQYRPVGSLTVSSEVGRLNDVVRQVQRDTGARLVPLPIVGTTMNPAVVDQLASLKFADGGGVANSQEVAVADASTLRAWRVHLTARERAALNNGFILIQLNSRAPSGYARIVSTAANAADGQPKPLARLRAYPAHLSANNTTQFEAAGVISPATARKLKLHTSATEAIATQPASQLSVRAIGAAAATADPVSWSVSVEERRQSSLRYLFVALAIGAALAVLVGTFSATSLALADARPDLRTLGEVGASPRTRRLVAGSHAFVIALLGAVLGVAVGFTPGITAAHLLADGLVIPWSFLTLVVIGLPLVAAAVTVAIARGPDPKPVREAG